MTIKYQGYETIQETISGKFPCDTCGSTDAVTWYDLQHGKDGKHLCYTWFCFSCHANINEWQSLKMNPPLEPPTEEKTYGTSKKKKPAIYPQPQGSIKADRWGITKEVCERFGITADARGFYFPYYDTKTGDKLGFNHRHMPLADKESSWVPERDGNKPGNTLFGVPQANKRDDGKETVVVVCEGEPDALAAAQMMSDRRYSFVSPSGGVQTMAACIQKNYSWLAGFDKIYFITDNDDAGRAGADAVSSKFPNAYRVLLPEKYNDVADMLKDGKEQEFRTALYGAKNRVRDSLLSVESATKMLMAGRGDAISTGIPELDVVLNGGLYVHELSVLMADPGAGKSTISKWLAYVAGNNTSIKPLYIPFEEATALCLRKFNNLINTEFKEKYEDVTDAAHAAENVLSVVELVDNQSLAFKDAEEFTRWLENLITETDTNFVVIDHLTSLAAKLSGDERLNIQAIMHSLNEVVINKRVHICVISHNKRQGNEIDADGVEVQREPTLRDGHGSGAIERYAFVLMALYGRDNQTKIKVLKNRNDGLGVARLTYTGNGRYAGTTLVRKERGEQTGIERREVGLNVGGGSMATQPQVNESEATEQGVQRNEGDTQELQPGLHNTERVIRGGERIPETTGRDRFSAFREAVRSGLYVTGSPAFQQFKHHDAREQTELWGVGDKSGSTVGVGNNDTRGVVESETTIKETGSIPRGATVGTEQQGADEIPTQSSGTSGLSDRPRVLLPIPERTTEQPPDAERTDIQPKQRKFVPSKIKWRKA